MTHRIPLLLGTMTIGHANTGGNRIYDPKQAQEMFDTCQQHGVLEADTARMYCEGTTETLMSSLDLHGMSIDTKCVRVLDVFG